jgi:hypothetical protein
MTQRRSQKTMALFVLMVLAVLCAVGILIRLRDRQYQAELTGSDMSNLASTSSHGEARSADSQSHVLSGPPRLIVISVMEASRRPLRRALPRFQTGPPSWECRGENRRTRRRGWTPGRERVGTTDQWHGAVRARIRANDPDELERRFRVPATGRNQLAPHGGRARVRPRSGDDRSP